MTFMAALSNLFSSISIVDAPEDSFLSVPQLGGPFLLRQGRQDDDNKQLTQPLVANLTVLLDTGDRSEQVYSIFTTGTARRFGTGLLEYNIVRANFALNSTHIKNIQAPCLLLSRDPTLPQLRDSLAPQCRIMLTNDEWCQFSAAENDVRQYYGSNYSNSVFLPLGPRHDFWEALETAKQLKSFSVKPSSLRIYVFNAMFSKSTSPSRANLANILGNLTRTFSNTKIKIAEKWASKLSGDHASASRYSNILLKSQFTLSPSGHHPECFRLYEAIEAGSIPIIVIDEAYHNHSCKDSLRHLLESSAPIVVLPSWDELEGRLKELLSDTPALDRRQEALRQWYSRFMSTVISNFETLMLSPRIAKNGTEMLN
jgi:hypothetical protein